jgi:ubiquitin-like-conjugating enzyme ATG10
MVFGRISEKEFQLAAEHFVSMSNKLFDDWKLENIQTSGPAVLTKRNSIASETGNVYNIEYHVIYSQSYEVPVLYLRLYDTSGQTVVDNSEAIKILSSASTTADQLGASKWETLTQQMHPVLQVPFFHLHPCHTETWMKVMSETDSSPENFNYLVTWLSFVGFHVGLHLPNGYASNTSSEK